MNLDLEEQGLHNILLEDFEVFDLEERIRLYHLSHKEGIHLSHKEGILRYLYL